MGNLAYFSDGHVEKIQSYYSICDHYISFMTESGAYVCTVVNGEYLFYKATPIKFVPTLEIEKIELTTLERTAN